MNQPAPQPHLNLKMDYQQSIASLIPKNGVLDTINFNYLENVLESLGVDKNVYTYALVPNGDERIRQIVSDAFKTLHERGISPELRNKLEKLWDYLEESDPLESADLIYVFGGTSQLGVLEAIRLKKKKYAPKIMFSGRHASYLKNSITTEALRYEQLAIQQGISPVDIIIEDKATNTPENVVYSAQVLQSMNFLPKSIIAISLPYHMRRAALTLQAGFNWEFKLIRHAGLSAKYSRDTYFNDVNGWTYIVFEYFKLYAARKNGHF